MNKEIIKLDEKDKKIVRELFINSRQSFSKIGKKVGLPKNVVAYRVKKIIDNELITLFCTIFDKERLGYLNCKILLKFHHFNEKLEKKILDFLKKTKKIHWVATLEGNYDFCIIFLARNIEEMYGAYNRIIYHFNNFILDKELAIQVKGYHFPYNFLYNRLEKQVSFKKREKNPKKPDKTDIKIINLMKQNSRISMLELMEKLELSPQVIRNRIKKMEKDVMIMGYKIRFDYSLIGLNYFYNFLNLTNVDKEKEQEVISFIASFPSTIKIVKEIGKWDLEFECVFPSHFELHDFLKQLKNKFPKNIQKIESSLICKIHDINTVKY
ncbi:hypothetical protein A3K73_01395 [Candidatus Pacearchaeota archaeon RBG_13_36_9]|nr:MAG: hypothetical protein A3K73_01395 [Candidatus Pacearchaeota archaeon RBG_13_36_9]